MRNSNASRAMGKTITRQRLAVQLYAKINSAHLATGLRINDDRSVRRASQDAMPSARLLLSKRRLRSPQRSPGKLPIASWSGFRPGTDDNNSTARVTVELSANIAFASSSGARWIRNSRRWPIYSVHAKQTDRTTARCCPRAGRRHAGPSFTVGPVPDLTSTFDTNLNPRVLLRRCAAVL